MDDATAAIQERNALKILPEVWKLKDNNEGLNDILAASDDPSFELTTSPKILLKSDKWHVHINKWNKK